MTHYFEVRSSHLINSEFLHCPGHVTEDEQNIWIVIPSGAGHWNTFQIWIWCDLALTGRIISSLYFILLSHSYFCWVGTRGMWRCPVLPSADSGFMSQVHTLTPIPNWVLGGYRHPFLGARVLEPSFACVFMCTYTVSRLYQYIEKVNIGAHHMIFKKAVFPWEATEYIFTRQWLIFLTFSFFLLLNPRKSD